MLILPSIIPPSTHTTGIIRAMLMEKTQLWAEFLVMIGGEQYMKVNSTLVHPYLRGPAFFFANSNMHSHTYQCYRPINTYIPLNTTHLSILLSYQYHYPPSILTPLYNTILHPSQLTLRISRAERLGTRAASNRHCRTLPQNEMNCRYTHYPSIIHLVHTYSPSPSL